LRDKQEETVAEIRDSVLGYLADCPSAADSVDGIRNWWLFQQLARYSHELVQQALDDLEKAGRVERSTLRDGSVLYRKRGVGENAA
jgi:hypothetical protein